MIAHLRGILLEKHPNQAIVEAGGVGYDVAIPVSTYSALPEPGAEVKLKIHTHLREDSLSLYGFASEEEKILFERLITVSGIGPRLAITVLSGLPIAELYAAIRAGAVERLVRIPGVGKKTAERIVLELREKLPLPAGAQRDAARQGGSVRPRRAGRAVRADQSWLHSRGGGRSGAQGSRFGRARGVRTVVSPRSGAGALKEPRSCDNLDTECGTGA
jgi:Holliday junction DNA helicase RuvA